MLKRIICLLLVLTLSFGILPLSVRAEDSENCDSMMIENSAETDILAALKSGESTGWAEILEGSFSGAAQVAEYVPTEAQVYQSMIAMKEQYPEGKPWTNDDKYTWNVSPRPNYIYIGYGCVAFCYILSDAAFGMLPVRQLNAGEFNFEDLKVGDILRVYNDTHSVSVLETYEDHIVLAEGNFNKSIHWGRTMSRQEVMSETDYIFTRYPEHEHSYQTTTRSATCTQPGSVRKYCAGCGDESTETIPALGHDPELRNVLAATLTTPGYTGDEICKRCEVIITPGASIPATGIAVDDVNFPNHVFLAFVSKEFDTNSDGFLSIKEVEMAQNILLRNAGAASLKGIEYLTELVYLDCSENQLTDLDLRKNTKLKQLGCSGNQLTTLDISKNTELIRLECDNNQFTALDVSNNTALVSLFCTDNHISELDLRKNTELCDLRCYSNQLTTLDLSQNPSMYQVLCGKNQITVLNVRNNPELCILHCNNNQLTTLDVSKNTKLMELSCFDNKLPVLDISKNTLLDYLKCSNNQLTALDLSWNPNLWYLRCDNNRLTSLDITSHQKMTDLSCAGNSYPIHIDGELDLSSLPGKFDVSKAKDWIGGSVSGTILTVSPASTEVSYTYDCGNGRNERFTLEVIESSTLPSPAKPTKVMNTVQGPRVYWKAYAQAKKYVVYRSETGKTGVYTKIGETLSTNFRDTSVSSGKTYFYAITAVVSGVESDRSDSMGITFVGTPDLTLRVNRGHGIGLRWNKVEGATGYAIYRKSYSGTDAWVRVATIEGGDTLSWDDTSVKSANGQIYRYTIRALAGSNMKTLSGCRSTGRTMVRITSLTLNSAVKASNTSVKCSWTKNSAVTGYEVRFMVGSEVYKAYTIGNINTTVKTFTGLPTGQTYKVQVRSYKKVDGLGSFYSAWSTAKYVTLK